MRWLFALLISATLSPAPFEASFNGVWVLNQRLSRFASPAKPDRLVMEVNSTASGWVCVLEVRTDTRGQHLQADQYSSRRTDPVPAAQRPAAAATNRVLLRSQGTGVVEEWAMAPDGLLLIKRPHPTALGTKHDRLVFQRAERCASIVNPLSMGSME
jgi:hypothetical protein